MKLFLVSFFALLFLVVPAKAEDVAADLSVREIEVSVGFTGSNLLVFGASKKRADIVVVIEGPLVQAKLWTKKRKFGFWINENPVTFDGVPGLYAIAASKPLDKIVSSETAAEYGLTLKSLFEPYQAPKGTYTDEDFYGLKKAQEVRHLYQENNGGVTLTKGGLFRADFDLPAAVPIGAYTAHIYLLRSGKVFSTQEVPLTVNRIGLEASINHLAYDRPFAYAFVALLLSLALGGGGALLFRRSS